VYSVLAKNDFSETGATEDEAAGVVDELLKTVPNIDFALLISEKHDGVHGSFRGVQKGVNVAELAKIFGGGGHDLAAAFNMSGRDLPSAKDEIIEKVKNYQANILGIKNVDDEYAQVENISSTLEMPPIDK